MTKDEFAAIKGREKAATPGPWKWHKGDSYDAYPMIYADEHEFPVLDIGCEDWPGRDEDAEFVAHARADVPNLIAEVRRYRELAKVVREILHAVGSAAGNRVSDIPHFDEYFNRAAELLKEVHDDQR